MMLLHELVRIPSSYRWRRMCITSFMKDGRGKEVRKWVKSGGEVELLPTTGRRQCVDRSTNESSATPRKGKREKREREGDG